MNTYGPAIEQEELVFSLPEQPAMPTPDSKGYAEWIKKETESPCPIPTVPTVPSPVCFTPVENSY